MTHKSESSIPQSWTWDVDAIVNAANRGMRGGGGIDGQVHRMAGSQLLQELRIVAPDGVPTGKVVTTAGFELKQKWILHVAGPVWKGGSHNEAESLAECYINCMAEAQRLRVKSIGFCSISTGIYGFPIERAAPIALRAVTDRLLLTGNLISEVVFAMFGKVRVPGV